MNRVPFPTWLSTVTLPFNASVSFLTTATINYCYTTIDVVEASHAVLSSPAVVNGAVYIDSYGDNVCALDGSPTSSP